MNQNSTKNTTADYTRKYRSDPQKREKEARTRILSAAARGSNPQQRSIVKYNITEEEINNARAMGGLPPLGNSSDEQRHNPPAHLPADNVEQAQPHSATPKVRMNKDKVMELVVPHTKTSKKWWESETEISLIDAHPEVLQWDVPPEVMSQLKAIKWRGVPPPQEISIYDLRDHFNRTIKSAATRKNYISKSKVLFQDILACDNILECIKDPSTASTIKDNWTNLNSRLGYVQMVVKIASVYPGAREAIGEEVYKFWDDTFQATKFEAQAENIANQDMGEVMPFAEIRKKVDEVFGTLSKESMYVAMIDDATVRDDLGIAKVVESAEGKDTEWNYIVIPTRGKKVSLVLNSYKTMARYGSITHEYSPEVSQKIRAYVTTLKKKEGDLLFAGKGGTLYNGGQLSSFVAGFLKKAGIDTKGNGAVNFLRKSKVSDELSEKKTPKTRMELARKLQHSPITSAKYVRRLKIE